MNVPRKIKDSLKILPVGILSVLGYVVHLEQQKMCPAKITSKITLS
jgi:hypothetical protein